MTLKARVIPCLDVKDGRVVKGINFVNLRDAGDPVESAIAYDRAGADELCFLDITASHEDRGILLDVVRRTAEVCFMPLTVGGGVRTTEDIASYCSPAPIRPRSIQRLSPTGHRAQASKFWRPVCRRHRRQRVSASGATPTLGGSPMAGGVRPASGDGYAREVAARRGRDP